MNRDTILFLAMLGCFPLGMAILRLPEPWVWLAVPVLAVNVWLFVRNTIALMKL